MCVCVCVRLCVCWRFEASIFVRLTFSEKQCMHVALVFSKWHGLQPGSGPVLPCCGTYCGLLCRLPACRYKQQPRGGRVCLHSALRVGRIARAFCSPPCLLSLGIPTRWRASVSVWWPALTGVCAVFTFAADVQATSRRGRRARTCNASAAARPARTATNSGRDANGRRGRAHAACWNACRRSSCTLPCTSG